MKKLLLIPLILLCFVRVNAQSFGSFASGVFVTQNGNLNVYNVTGSGVNQIGPNGPQFTGSLGTYTQNSGALLLNGGEVKTYKDNGANVCGANMYYSVHPVGATAPFATMALPFKAGCGGAVFTDNLGPCGGNDQKWSSASSSLDLTTYCPGTYAVDVYYDIPGSNSSTSGCDQTSNIGQSASPAGSMTFTITGTTPTISASKTTICAGDMATLTASDCAGNVTWSNGASGASISVPAGTYSATCSINGCPGTPSADIVITEKVIAPPTISGNNTVCPGATTTLVAGNCAGEVSWSNGATGSSIDAPAGTYTASCTMDGCTSIASSPLTVTETPVTPPTISGSAKVCPGETTALTASGCGGTVTWSTGATGATIVVPAGIDTAKLDLATIQILSSWDPVTLNVINAKTVSFNFIGVDLSRSIIDLPNSQTEVVFKIKRKAGLQPGTEIYNRVGIYFDANEVVETEYAASKIIEACDSTATMPGKVTADVYVKKGSNVSKNFTLTDYSGIITGWEISTDPTFVSNVQQVANYTETLAYNKVADSTVYIRALVQTGGCAITASKPAAIYPICTDLIQNGSFETPVISHYSLTKVPSWTNMVDNGNIEIHHNLLATSTDGAQYIELNGETFGNIYQDMTVLPGKAINWSLDHRARLFNDETITVTLSAMDGSNAQTWTHIGATNAWQTLAGTYQTTASQTTLRMRIVSSKGWAQIGNFIDNVKATYALCSGTAAKAAPETIAPKAAMENTMVAGSMSISPNPVISFAAINLSGFNDGQLNIDVISTNGIVVKTVKANYTNGASLSLDLSGLRSGLYLIKAQQGDKLSTIRIVKK